MRIDRTIGRILHGAGRDGRPRCKDARIAKRLVTLPSHLSQTSIRVFSSCAMADLDAVLASIAQGALRNRVS